MQELDHSRALANDLQKAQEEQLAEIARISKELELKPLGLWYPFGSALSADHVRTALTSPNSHSDHASQSRQNQFSKADLLVFLYFVMLMFRVAFAGARRMQQRDCPNAWSGRKPRSRDVPAR
jgi:hypothetical protein